MSGYNKTLSEQYINQRKNYTYTDERLFAVIEQLGLTGKNILDFGCGNGIHSFELAKRGAASVLGIDSSEEMIRVATAQLSKEKDLRKIQFVVADGNNLPVDNESFDLVLANYVLVHFEKLDQPLSEIWRVLRPGGALIATVNNANIADPTLHEQAIPLRLGGPTGVVVVRDYLRSDTETKHLLETSGFSIDKFESIENAGATVDRDFKEVKKIADFHCVLFVAVKA